MKNKIFIPYILYIALFIFLLLFRDKISNFVSKDWLFIIAACSAIILAVFVLIAKYQKNSKKKTG